MRYRTQKAGDGDTEGPETKNTRLEQTLKTSRDTAEAAEAILSRAQEEAQQLRESTKRCIAASGQLRDAIRGGKYRGEDARPDISQARGRRHIFPASLV